MWISIDCSAIPPEVALRDGDDFTSFKVVIDVGEHAWVPTEMVRALAYTPSSTWEASLGEMTAYAASKGWTDGVGNLRAHVEIRRG